MKASGLSGYRMIYFGMNQQPQNQNDINQVGMAWMPPMDNEYVVGNVAFVKKNGTVTQKEIETIYNKQNNDDQSKNPPPQQMMCCIVL